MQALEKLAGEAVAILILLAVIGIVLARLPKVDLGHSPAFLRRRFWNWFPLGMTYAFLYMGRYNLSVSKNALGELMTIADFNQIKAVGTIVYGFAFLLNGPLTDRLGGRTTMLICVAGTVVMNGLMGGFLFSNPDPKLLVPVFSVLYGANMYFQSFGAVSIVKVNAHWFHVRERGTFGGIFGILISLGIYFAYDGGRLIADSLPGETYWLFWIPAIVLVGWGIADYFLVFDSPSKTGHAELVTDDATWEEPAGGAPAGSLASVGRVAKMMLTNPVIVVIGLIELCSGFIRTALMDVYYHFAKQTHIMDQFVPSHWGMTQCVAGIVGGMVAGVISDRLFQSRRGPVAVLLYGALLLGSIGVYFTIASPILAVFVTTMMLSIIGVHGMLSGTASMDFGGKKNVGIAVGIIDGLVYLGQFFQSITLGQLLPSEERMSAAERAIPENWRVWPIAMMPVAAVGLLLSLRLWNARPTKGGAAH